MVQISMLQCHLGVQSALELLLQQLVAVHDQIHEENGNQGEVFVLQDHFLPSYPY